MFATRYFRKFAEVAKLAK